MTGFGFRQIPRQIMLHWGSGQHLTLASDDMRAKICAYSRNSDDTQGGESADTCSAFPALRGSGISFLFGCLMISLLWRRILMAYCYSFI